MLCFGDYYITTKSDFENEVEITTFTLCGSTVIFHSVGWFKRKTKDGDETVYFANTGYASLPSNYLEENEVTFNFNWTDTQFSRGTEVAWTHSMTVATSLDGSTINKKKDERYNDSNPKHTDVTSMFHIGNWELVSDFDKEKVRKEVLYITSKLLNNI